MNMNTNMQPVPSVYNEGFSQYETIAKLLYEINQLIDGLNLSNIDIEDLKVKKLELEAYLDDIGNKRKLSASGDFSGTWNGLQLHETSEGLFTDFDNAKGTFGTVTLRLDNVDSEIERVENKNKNIIANVLDFGAKANDNTFDNTTAIQQAIDYIYSNKGGTVLIPQGVFYVNNTLDLKPYVILEGVSHNHLDSNDIGSVIEYSGTSFIDIISAIKTTDEVFYRWGCKIKQLQIRGNNKGTGIHLHSCAYTHLEDVSIEYCNIGLKIVGGMLDKYDRVNIRYCVAYGLYVPNDLKSTTQVFNNCYIGQHRLYDAIPIYIGEHGGTDFTFNKLTFESNNKSAYFGKAINVKFNDLYIENCPLNDTYAMSFGMHDVAETHPELNNYGGIYAIHGSNIIGLPTGWNVKSLFYLFNADAFTITDSWLSRYKDIIIKDGSCICKPVIISSECENGLFTNKFDVLTYATIINCIQDGNKIINITPVTTYNITLLNSWVNFGSGYKDFTVTKGANNIVSIEGTIKSGTTNTICNLPVELRPTSVVFGTVSAVDSAVWKSFPCMIMTNGDVISQATNTGFTTALNIKYQL